MVPDCLDRKSCGLVKSSFEHDDITTTFLGDKPISLKDAKTLGARLGTICTHGKDFISEQWEEC